MKKPLWGFVGILGGIVVCGCSQPTRTLMDLNREQAAQQRFVDARDAKFKMLLDDVRGGRLQPGGMKKRVIARYGDPVLAEGDTLVYRPVTGFFGKTKIYLIFDKGDVLNQIKLEEAR